MFAPDERLVASGTTGKSMVFSDPATGKSIRILQPADGNQATPKDFSFSSDGKFFLTAGYYDGSVRLWQFADGKKLRDFKHGSSAGTACFTPGDKFIR